jgi:hypothetical protein
MRNSRTRAIAIVISALVILTMLCSYVVPLLSR